MHAISLVLAVAHRGEWTNFLWFWVPVTLILVAFVLWSARRLRQLPHHTRGGSTRRTRDSWPGA